jgi:transcriptional regulator with XRE-family HTH domain
VIKKTERAAFSLRLREALRNAGLPDDSPTVLYRNITVRGIPVTVHAVRKWLMGEAIPTQEKLIAIATWLGVPPDWLRFGTGDGVANAPAGGQIAPLTLRMLESFGRLVERDQQLVQAMIDNMLQAGGGEA